MRDFLFHSLISSHHKIWGEPFWRNLRNFFRAEFFCLFFGIFKLPPESLGLESSFFQNIRSFFRAGFFHFSSSESSVSGNINNFFQGLRFPKYKKTFLLRQYKEFFRGFRSLKYKNSFLLRKYKKFFDIRT